MSLLKPGEKKIIDLLAREGSLNNSKIENGTGLSNRAISNYLNSLQVKGFIEREIEEKKDKKGNIVSRRISRKYKLKPISYAGLLFNDLLDFIKEYLDKTVNENLKNNISVYETSTLLSEQISYFWLFLLDSKATPKLRESFYKALKENDKIQLQLLEIGEKIEKNYEKHILSTYSPKQQDIIKDYEKYLVEIVKKVHINNRAETKKILYTDSLTVAELEIRQEYPNMKTDIPKEMIEIKAKKIREEREKAFYNVYFSSDIEDLETTLIRMEKVGQLMNEDEVSEETKKEIDEMVKFLGTPKHKKLYEKYVSRCNDSPKSLLILPSSGFKGHLDKLKNFPNVFNKQIVGGMTEKRENVLKEYEKTSEKFIEECASLEGLSVEEVKKQMEELE
ncbi:MAG: hypothetical protein JW702_07980 [Clostridiales bacterium]|nr:hypothetical protein [Clostridiales bacterium]